ncbi:DUF917 domain-containing protein [Wenjunlia tyrosinilytica]|uniref:DUF917 domain-containing protein n=1 Tax=Wenjunlia tyrosinilytica TaxID=1544741 RepID=A0A917ZT06_9ACTN|nr:DUF917 domain-containing protein [Wenjunlia tyrosinilytica]GGO93477.1 hypothetical protein GCM10012280_46110 [Wenjunlia tyrosinilytica]
MAYELTDKDLLDLATGAALLGTGGGGDPLIGRLLVEQALADGCKVRVLDPDELDDDMLVIASAMMGAPTVVLEKVPSGREAVAALRRLEDHLGRQADAVIPMECGGLNSMIPLLVAARADLPVVDGDGMGRAFPELQMETFGVYGVPASPLAIADERGHTAIVATGADNHRTEWFARALTIRMGGSAYIAEYPMTGAQVKRTAIPRTLRLALTLGRTLREAKQEHRDPFDALIDALKQTPYEHGQVLFSGKVTDVSRHVSDGFTQGHALIHGLDSTGTMRIEFRNENLLATVDDRVVAIVPDLITLLDADTATPVTTETLRYGMRVRVFGISTPPIMRTAAALDVFGPAAFGLTQPWQPLEEIAN